MITCDYGRFGGSKEQLHERLRSGRIVAVLAVAAAELGGERENILGF